MYAPLARILSQMHCEWMHQIFSNVQRTLVHNNPPQNMASARDIVDDALATAMHAMQTMLLLSLGVLQVLLTLPEACS